MKRPLPARHRRAVSCVSLNALCRSPGAVLSQHRSAMKGDEEVAGSATVAPAGAAADGQQQQGGGEAVGQKRKVCGRCGRPGRACLCSALPSQPLHTRGEVLVLQHPHEKKRKLATVPLLSCCLKRCHVLSDRKFHDGKFEMLDKALAAANDKSCPTFLLFPGPGVTNLTDASTAAVPGAQKEEDSACLEQPAYRLLVIDGTWQQANEMYKAVSGRLFGVEAAVQQVQLPEGESDSGGHSLPLRMEPQEGCVTTMEAVGQALGILEGPETMGAVLKPLRHLVEFQAQFDPRMKARLADEESVVKRTKRSEKLQKPRRPAARNQGAQEQGNAIDE